MCKLLHNTGEPLPQDSTEDYLPSTLIEAARELEFDYIACGWRPPLPISAPKITIKSNYPNVWSERYVEAGYIKRDPTISASQKSLRPIAWTDELFSKARDLWGEAQDIGLKFGCAQSIRDGRGNRSMVTLARTHEPISQAEIKSKTEKIVNLAVVVHEHFYVSMALAQQDKVATLTDRELEVLRWSADGKTAAEISMILPISLNTVNFHLKNVMNKLSTPNKAAAVLYATVNGLLD